MGKPPEYVLFYIEEYKRKVQSIRLKASTQGSIYTASIITFIAVMARITN